MNWAFFVLRFAIGLAAVSLIFFSQRFWHRGIWRITANFRSKPLRIGVRVVWLMMAALVIFAFLDSVRVGHRHLIPRGTFLAALVGLWFFSALFAFLAIKLVRGIDLLWSWLRKAAREKQVPVATPSSSISSPISLTPAQTSAKQSSSDQIIPRHIDVNHLPVEQLADPSRRYFFRAATAAAGAAPFLGAMYGFAAERLDYRVRRVEIPIPNLPVGLEGMRIAQLSDIHLSGYMPRSEVRRAVQMANELGADLAVVTGDFITGANDPLADCIDEIRMLRAPLGVWGCNGNHEIYAGVEDVAQALFAQAGMRLLRQENVRLSWRGSDFNLIGVDYQRERTNDGNKRQTLQDIENLVRRDMPNILLSHNPNSFPRAAELGIELSLAGHTHGGQIQVEILDHRLSPARFMTDYIAGLYQRPLLAPSVDITSSSQPYPEAPRVSPPGAGETKAMASIYVNRGLGTVGAPVRIGMPPEITLIVLRHA
ncbi:MAG: metallophosphoesterase [Acidobacteriota bacterium]|nr:metallophosphoesterase [Acidobacteriota bacterium]